MPPQPSETVPHLPSQVPGEQVSGPQTLATPPPQLGASEPGFVLQVPHSSVPPHPSGCVPQVAPSSVQVFAVQCVGQPESLPSGSVAASPGASGALPSPTPPSGGKDASWPGWGPASGGPGEASGAGGAASGALPPPPPPSGGKAASWPGWGPASGVPGEASGAGGSASGPASPRGTGVSVESRGEN